MTQCLLLWHILSSPFSRSERLLLIRLLKVMPIITANGIERLCVNHCAELFTCISTSSNPHPSLGGGSYYLHVTDGQAEAQRLVAYGHIASGRSWHSLTS